MYLAFVQWKAFAKSLNPTHVSSASTLYTALTKLIFRRYRQGLGAIIDNNDYYKNKLLRMLNRILPYVNTPERFFFNRWLRKTYTVAERERANRDKIQILAQRLKNKMNLRVANGFDAIK